MDGGIGIGSGSGGASGLGPGLGPAPGAHAAGRLLDLVDLIGTTASTLDSSSDNNHNRSSQEGPATVFPRQGAASAGDACAPTLRRATHNSSPAIFGGGGMRRTMSGSKRPHPNADFGGAAVQRAHGLGSAMSSRNVRGSASAMNRSSTYTAMGSGAGSNAGWDGLQSSSGRSSQNASWNLGGAGRAGGGGGMTAGGGGGGQPNEEASYQQSVSGGSLAHGGAPLTGMGGRMGGANNPFLKHSSSDVADLLSRQGALAGGGGGSGGSSGMGGAGLVFDPRRGTVGAAGGEQHQVRIPRPSGADFLSMMGLQRPGGGGGGSGSGSGSGIGGGGGGSGRKPLSGTSGTLDTSAGGQQLQQQQLSQQPKMKKRGSAMLRRSSHNLSGMQLSQLPEENAMEVTMDAPGINTPPNFDFSQKQSANRSSGLCGAGNGTSMFGNLAVTGQDFVNTMQQQPPPPPPQQQQQQPPQQQATAAPQQATAAPQQATAAPQQVPQGTKDIAARMTATEIHERMQQLRNEQARASNNKSHVPGGDNKVMGGDGAPSGAGQEGNQHASATEASALPSVRESIGSEDKNHESLLSLGSALSGVSSTDFQNMMNEEFGKIAGDSLGDSCDLKVDLADSANDLGGFDFDQHAKDVAAEITDQVAAELLGDAPPAASDGGGSGKTSAAALVRAAEARASNSQMVEEEVTKAKAQTKKHKDKKQEPDYDALGAAFEPTPISAESERILYERRTSDRRSSYGRQSTGDLSMGNDSDSGLLTETIANMGSISTISAATPPVSPTPGIVSATPQLSTTAGIGARMPSPAISAQQQYINPINNIIAQGAIPGGSGNAAQIPLPTNMQQQLQQPSQQQHQQRHGSTDSTGLNDEGANGKISVQAQLQHVAHGGAALHQQTAQLMTDGSVFPANLEGPRDANWMMNAILQLSKVGPTTPDRDGLLPIHLACLYCPNDKKLVGNILIDNPKSAMFVVNPPPEIPAETDAANTAPQDVIVLLTSNALAAARKKANPSVMIRQLQGSYPLHIALRSSGGEKVTYEVVKLLSLSGPSILTTSDPFGCVPLSIALQNKVGSQIIRYLVERNKGAASIHDKQGNYPLHYACSEARGKKRYSLAVIKLITQAYPKALRKKNNDNKTPLELAYGPDGKDQSKSGDAIIDFLEKTIEKLLGQKPGAR